MPFWLRCFLQWPVKSSSLPHTAKNVEQLKKALHNMKTDVNSRDGSGGALIHSLVERVFSDKRERSEFLLTLLTYSSADINLTNGTQMTALHLTAQLCDLHSVKVLVAFGAQVNLLNADNKTPLDLLNTTASLSKTIRRTKTHSLIVATETISMEAADFAHEQKSSVPSISHQDYIKLHDLLVSVGAKEGRLLQEQLHDEASQLPAKLLPFPHLLTKKGSTEDSDDYVKCVPGEDSWVDSIPGRYKELDTHIRRMLADPSDTMMYSTDEAFACALQLRELTLLRKSGSRVLSLDGGGMKGLIQIEVLEQLEKLTQRKITEIFDWIVGTSVGGIVALAIVYAKKTLKELRQLMFQMKDEVFGSSHGSYGCNTEALERILKDTFGNMTMNTIKYPRVMISAVNKSTTDLQLHFFNNCFQTWPKEEQLRLNKMEVWKVARYTSAGPLYFEECDSYVDGGILANNPCMEGLTRIQDYYRQVNQKLPISLVVSVGCGVLPPSTIGSIDAQRFLFFGRHWLPTSDGPGLTDTVKNLATLMSTAITESETSAKHCENCCEEQGIQYFRFSPRLERVIAPSETNNEVLFDMIISTRLQSEVQKIHELIQQLYKLSDYSRKMYRSYDCTVAKI
ncbi:hypothetical protein EMCRGX_G034263 [Ephydatia muelleri]